jgi:nucleotide-binding universal stress UspA family protein
MFEKILVCLDGSPLAEAVLPYITQESRHFTRIVLIRVVDQPVVDIPIGIPGANLPPMKTEGMMARFRKELVEDAPAYLEKVAQPLREKGLNVVIVVLEGQPSRTIIDYARDNGVTLIAAATHGHSGLREVVMGSTAEYLLKHSGLPVLMVTLGGKKKEK